MTDRIPRHGPNGSLFDRAIDAERRAPPPADAEVDRVLAHVSAKLGLDLVPSPPPVDSGPAQGPAPADAAPTAPTLGSSAAEGVTTTAMSAHPVAIAMRAWATKSSVVSLVVGIGIGATGHAVISRRPASAPDEPAPMSARVAEPPHARTVADPRPDPDASVGASTSAPADVVDDRPTTPPPPAEPSSDSLDSERRLIDAARAALGRGDTGAAGRFLDQHARRYRTGYFVEDRELLRERWLRLVGLPNESNRSDPPTEPAP